MFRTEHQGRFEPVRRATPMEIRAEELVREYFRMSDLYDDALKRDVEEGRVDPQCFPRLCHKYARELKVRAMDDAHSEGIYRELMTATFHRIGQEVDNGRPPIRSRRNRS